jgi:hypothetical protein
LRSGGRRTIGAQLGIEDAALAQTCKRFNLKLEKDRKLEKKIERFGKRVLLSNVETHFVLHSDRQEVFDHAAIVNHALS